jgi:23S rRNA pseudouridine1911/1915/1917 synthase
VTTRTYTVPQHASGERLDVALPLIDTQFSRSKAGSLIRDGLVVVTHADGTPVKKIKAGMAVQADQVVVVDVPDPEEYSVAPEDIPLDIKYEDDDLLVINKPPGLVVHPAPGHSSGTLVNALAAHSEKLSSVGGPFRAGIVHRLDKDTSGLLIVAKHDEAHRILAAQLADRTLSREYTALVWGNPQPPYGKIVAPIGRSRSDGKSMAVDGRAQRTATTHYELIERYIFTSLLRIRLETGRTHQIRVHLQHISRPVVGDLQYGGQTAARGVALVHRRAALELLTLIDRQALHASKLAFIHPSSGEEISVVADPPEDFQRLVTKAAQR